MGASKPQLTNTVSNISSHRNALGLDRFSAGAQPQLGAPQRTGFMQETNAIQNRPPQSNNVGTPVQLGVPQPLGLPQQISAPAQKGQFDLNKLAKLPREQVKAAIMQNPALMQQMIAAIQSASQFR